MSTSEGDPEIYASSDSIFSRLPESRRKKHEIKKDKFGNITDSVPRMSHMFDPDKAEIFFTLSNMACPLRINPNNHYTSVFFVWVFIAPEAIFGNQIHHPCVPTAGGSRS